MKGMSTNNRPIFKPFTGTAWFHKSGKYLVTALHVVNVMNITNNWEDVAIYQPDAAGKLILKKTIPMRLNFVYPIRADGVAILELKQKFKKAKPLHIRTTSPVVGEKLTGIGYFDGRVHYSKGNCAKFDLFGKTNQPNEVFLELRNARDSIALDAGSSGGPVFDKEGHVVAIVIASTSLSLTFGDGSKLRIAAPNGYATNIGIPLSEMAQVKNMKASR